MELHSKAFSRHIEAVEESYQNVTNLLGPIRIILDPQPLDQTESTAKYFLD